MGANVLWQESLSVCFGESPDGPFGDRAASGATGETELGEWPLFSQADPKAVRPESAIWCRLSLSRSARVPDNDSAGNLVAETLVLLRDANRNEADKKEAEGVNQAHQISHHCCVPADG